MKPMSALIGHYIQETSKQQRIKSKDILSKHEAAYYEA